MGQPQQGDKELWDGETNWEENMGRVCEGEGGLEAVRRASRWTLVFCVKEKASSRALKVYGCAGQNLKQIK